MTAIELINIIAPEHSRTSCSDENICNGFYHECIEEWGTFVPTNTISAEYHERCARCALLNLANGRSEDNNKVIEGITFIKKEFKKVKK